jgi:hypothetical protein
MAMGTDTIATLAVLLLGAWVIGALLQPDLAD